MRSLITLHVFLVIISVDAIPVERRVRQFIRFGVRSVSSSIFHRQNYHNLSKV